MRLTHPDLCTGCMACVDNCHHAALSVKVDCDGFYQIDADKNKCVECGLCETICPVLNGFSKEIEKIELSKPYAVWCTDEPLRKASASGGAFAAIAKVFLEEGSVVYGAAIDGFEVHHRRIDRKEDLPQILGSKYQHSRMDGIYRQVTMDLREGNVVLFSGLSCQVAGVLSSVPKKLQANLFTIDTICGGVSTMLPMRKLQKSDDYTSIHSFRNKDNGWKSKGYKYALKLNKKDGSICDLGTDNMMIQCFCHKETKRSSCLECQFNGFHRPSDATIGDFWGDTRFKEQHQQGLSVLITHSNRLDEFLKEAPIHLEDVKWRDMVEFNPSYYWSHYSYLRKSITRKLVFRDLRTGNYLSALKRMEGNSILKRIEYRLFQHYNEQEKLEYLQRVLEKQL